MNKVEHAVSCYREGFNCSQAVLSSYSKLFGLKHELALKVAQAFGGGMARMGQTCGAVTGAFMVIGLKYGKIKAEDEQAKESTYENVREFVKRFESLNGSIACRELLGYDISTPEGIKSAEEKNLFDNLCPEFVQNAISILEKLM